MTARPAFGLDVDLPRNLVHTRYSGHITVVEMQAAVAQITVQLPALKAGFAILADWSQLESMGLDCVPHLTAIMDLCRVHRAGTIVRILPDPSKDIGINLLSAIHLRGQVKIITCDTLEEAERALK